VANRFVLPKLGEKDEFTTRNGTVLFRAKSIQMAGFRRCVFIFDDGRGIGLGE
jgi:hypothetical protein